MTKEEIKEAVWGKKPKVRILFKILEWGTIITGLWALGLPAANDHIDSRIELYEEARLELEGQKTPFRVLLSQEMGVPSDRVHIAIGQIKHDVDSALDSVQHFSNFWIPYLRTEKNRIRPRLIITEDGDEYWIADDNKAYRVERNDEGYGFYRQNGEWKPIFK